MMFKVVICLSLFVSAALAIDCYSCVACDSPTGTCSGESCIKTTSEAGGYKVITRSCSPVKLTDGCTETSIAGASGSVCYCSSAQCNGQAGLSAPRVVALLFGALMTAGYLTYYA